MERKFEQSELTKKIKHALNMSLLVLDKEETKEIQELLKRIREEKLDISLSSREY